MCASYLSLFQCWPSPNNPNARAAIEARYATDLQSLSLKVKALDERTETLGEPSSHETVSIQSKEDLLEAYAVWLSKRAQEHFALASDLQPSQDSAITGEWVQIRQVCTYSHSFFLDDPLENSKRKK